MNKIHFISGLPRSGSTLLAAIIKQNPKFRANMSGPVAGMVGTLLENMSGKNEFSIFLNDDQRQKIIRSVFNAYYDDCPEQLVFDTSRIWCSRIALLSTLFPDAKIIACVRHVSWVIDSIEQLVQKNVFQPSSIFNYLAGGTVYSRAEGVAGGDGLVGFAYNALKQAYYSNLSPGRLMLLQYESLVADPQRCLSEVYDFIGEPEFKHDFENIVFDASEFDERSGTPGLHKIHPKISPNTRQTLLPPDLFQRFVNDSFWLNPSLLRKDVKVV